MCSNSKGDLQEFFQQVFKTPSALPVYHHQPANVQPPFVCRVVFPQETVDSLAFTTSEFLGSAAKKKDAEKDAAARALRYLEGAGYIDRGHAPLPQTWHLIRTHEHQPPNANLAQHGASAAAAPAGQVPLYPHGPAYAAVPFTAVAPQAAVQQGQQQQQQQQQQPQLPQHPQLPTEQQHQHQQQPQMPLHLQLPTQQQQQQQQQQQPQLPQHLQLPTQQQQAHAQPRGFVIIPHSQWHQPQHMLQHQASPQYPQPQQQPMVGLQQAQHMQPQNMQHPHHHQPQQTQQQPSLQPQQQAVGMPPPQQQAGLRPLGMGPAAPLQNPKSLLLEFYQKVTKAPNTVSLSTTPNQPFACTVTAPALAFGWPTMRGEVPALAVTCQANIKKASPRCTTSHSALTS